jgi:hypothetical protein
MAVVAHYFNKRNCDENIQEYIPGDFGAQQVLGKINDSFSSIKQFALTNDKFKALGLLRSDLMPT